ncbi:hypothetical protein FDG96_gp24 [Bacillus phage Mgbh1]|uniref:Uncharacterized protein n=1 Tax=Bacillus phage Mgbh1 TaxID=1796993 RepID=A0A142F1M6_9CAUD|nr:hypothetical protein FDG96_gp24 [Bacillus phage Mgbh1]AMQ66683.1 hypothetical protein [Bacillus phage Mgbh1]
MITYHNLIGSYRVYLSGELGIDVHWKHQKMSQPKVFPYITIEFTVNTISQPTKLNDLIVETPRLTFGIHADTLASLNDIYTKTRRILFYENIPLLSVDGDPIGKFKVEQIDNETNVIGGDYQQTSEHHRIYIDTRLSVKTVKTKGEIE